MLTRTSQHTALNQNMVVKQNMTSVHVLDLDVGRLLLSGRVFSITRSTLYGRMGIDYLWAQVWSRWNPKTLFNSDRLLCRGLPLAAKRSPKTMPGLHLENKDSPNKLGRGFQANYSLLCRKYIDA